MAWLGVHHCFFLLLDDCHWTSKYINFKKLCDFNGGLMYGFGHHCHCFSCVIAGSAVGITVITFQNLHDANGCVVCCFVHGCFASPCALHDVIRYFNLLCAF